LFYEAVRVFDLVKEVAKEEIMWGIKFLENVVPDEEDVRVMTSALGMHPCWLMPSICHEPEGPVFSGFRCR
jgi:hypothetical protein